MLIGKASAGELNTAMKAQINVNNLMVEAETVTLKFRWWYTIWTPE